LEVLDVVDGGEPDATGVVEFVARCRVAGREHRLHERSRFVRRAGRWVYVDGTVS
jgi:SEC-C motif domain protein